MTGIVKKKINSKNKGNTFERKIANLLSDRFKEKTGIEKSFRRSIDSGSFFGASNQKRLETHNSEKATFGDIMCPDNFLYEIELKHYKTPPSFQSIISQDCKQLDGWIAQCKQDSNNAKKKMALIIKYNNVQEMILLEELPDGIKSIINYKQYFIIDLITFLSLSDNYYFN